ncbi:MAG: aminotransferase class I/II-fold pyridoxal phosphate-dependent enzyme [Candidatus Eisenbacteria bacterium]|nr:aminotransferase class I/II-fold pyridoxal phosphate-dependent enzyme [Candidatus Eisenbacteria bacterium]
MGTDKATAGRLDRATLRILDRALARLDAGFTGLPPADTAPLAAEGIEAVMLEVATRMRDNAPLFHPLYAGQMLKPPHPVARLAYALAQWINPNNHALESSRASSAMEREAVAEIATMFGWTTHLGHLTGGGTMANLEALWVAGRLAPGRVVLGSSQAHYTHGRIGEVLGLAFEPVACDRKARMDLAALETRLAAGDVGTVVATMGTTAAGAVDPLPAILALRERYGFRVHADAAYGGYFALGSSLGDDARGAYDRLDQVDSIVIDPHKHGLQPYGCGCVLFRDPTIGRFYKHDSPYTYFGSKELHLGEISLECSRAGAAAVALWATQRLLPLMRGGVFARALDDSRAAALALHARLAADARFAVPFAPELDIVVWAPRAATAAEASVRSRRLFDAAADRHLHLARADLPAAWFGPEAGFAGEPGTVTCLRSALMKPEHRAWLDRIWTILDAAGRDALGGAAR